ncbi:MAG: hypothetical protein ACFFD4_20025 [Candidatus Odinarchaeota archaeon]
MNSTRKDLHNTNQGVVTKLNARTRNKCLTNLFKLPGCSKLTRTRKSTGRTETLTTLEDVIISIRAENVEKG